MSGSRMRVARVYAGISAVSAEFAENGIAKLQVNQTDGYAYRSIDDVMARLAPLLVKHRLCILPRVLERTTGDRRAGDRSLLFGVCIKVAFDIVSVRDGSAHVIEAYGEALDEGDKATAKAMSAAFKQAMFQTFCIPAPEIADADASSPRPEVDIQQPDPVQGWDQWSRDIQDLIMGCESEDAIVRVQETYQPLLRTASRRRPDLFTAIGQTMTTRKQSLPGATVPGRQARGNSSMQAKSGNGTAQSHSVNPAIEEQARDQTSA
ncbi:MAG: ERF family protein [Novosphingobium sp.]|nr:ERF family protein [Novosphingobium sp.]